MHQFFAFFVKRHTLAIIVTVMTMLLGLLSLSTIKRDLFPMVDFGEMVITAAYPGTSPADIELKITNKIEDALDAISGIDKTFSISSEGFVLVDILFDPDIKNTEKVKRDIRNAIANINDFPSDMISKPSIKDIDSSIFPVMEVGLSGDVPYSVLRDAAKSLETKLKALPSVSRLDHFSLFDREVQIQVLPDKLTNYQLSLSHILHAIKGHNIQSTAGNLLSSTQEKSIVTLEQFQHAMDVQDVIVRSNFDGRHVRVKDVADIQYGFEDKTSFSYINGKPTISFLVYKTDSADIIRASDEVSDLLEREKKLLPKDVSFVTAMDQSYYVRNRFKVALSNGFLGLILVLLVLTLFLNRRIAFWVALGIPVTVLGVIFCLPLFNSYLDLVSLTAIILVLGIIVDDAIIISENITKHREAGAKPLDAAINGIHEVYKPVLTTILTTFLAFCPMFFMSGILGKFIYVIPLVISLALVISLFEVTVALPAHLLSGLRNHTIKKQAKSHFFNAFRRQFYRFIKKWIRYRYRIVAGFVAMFVATILFASIFMDFSLFPNNVADQFYINVQATKGSSLEATTQAVRGIESILKTLPSNEVQAFRTRIGMSGDNFMSMNNPDRALLLVNLTSYDKRDRSASEIVEYLRQKTADLPGISRIVFDIDSGGPPVGKPITILIMGDNDVQRSKLTDEVMAFLATLPGTKDLDRNDRLGKDRIVVDINHERLAQFGLSVSDVAASLRLAYDGAIATSIRSGSDDINFRVRLAKESRDDIEILKKTLILNPTQRLVTLEDVATLRFTSGEPDLHHYQGTRSTTVVGDIAKGKNTPIGISTAVSDHVDLDKDWPGMSFVFGGEVEETESSVNDLYKTFVIACIAIYLLLVLLFNSVLQPFIVMLAIPFGISGVILAFALHGQPLGFLAVIGIIGLSGVVVNDSLVLVHHINTLRQRSPQVSIQGLVAQATTNRLRAVIVTSLTTVSGLLPMAYGLGGSDPFIAPLALAMGFGIFFATPIILIFVPCLFVIFLDIQKWTPTVLGNFRKLFSLPRAKRHG